MSSRIWQNTYPIISLKFLLENEFVNSLRSEDIELFWDGRVESMAKNASGNASGNFHPEQKNKRGNIAY